MSKRFWYMATPYTNYPTGREAAFRDACFQAALLIREGIAAFCPIAHSHPIAEIGNLDATDHDLWLPADEPMMDAAFGLIVCLMDGWRESRGVRHEIDRFHEAIKPIVQMVPGKVPVRGIREAEELEAARGECIRPACNPSVLRVCLHHGQHGSQSSSPPGRVVLRPDQPRDALRRTATAGRPGSGEPLAPGASSAPGYLGVVPLRLGAREPAADRGRGAAGELGDCEGGWIMAVDYSLRPDECSECGKIPPPTADGRPGVQGHHDDYGQPDEVRWLYPSCHSAWHREHTPKGGEDRPHPTALRLSRSTLRTIDSIAEKFGASKTWVIEEAVRRLAAWARREGKR